MKAIRHRISRRRGRIPTLVLIALIAAGGPAAASDPPVCGDESLLVLAAAPYGPRTPWTPAAGSVVIDSTYYQNASRVGGTALAAYPLAEADVGLSSRVDAVVGAPAQIAESGLHGAGLFPRTRVGYGAGYRFVQSGRLAVTTDAVVAPPGSVYAPSLAQPAYALGLLSAYRLTSLVTLTGDAQAADLHLTGQRRILPSQTFGAEIGLPSTTALSADLGRRDVVTRVRAQSFGDVAVEHELDRHVLVDVGVGSAFNPTARQKSHYLGAGLVIRPGR